MDATHLIPMNPRDYLILFALVEKERHGYGIVTEVERHGSVRLDPANLYRAIKRMIGTGLVEDAGQGPAPDGVNERRRYYRITGFGHRVVQLEAQRLAELTAMARARDLISGADVA